MLHEVLALASLYNVRFPEIVRETEELTVRIEVAPTEVKVRFVQAALAVTVTVRPFSRKTLSPATGTEAPEAPPEVADHVEVLFQFPDATEYLSAATTFIKRNDKTPASNNFLQVDFRLIILRLFNEDIA